MSVVTEFSMFPIDKTSGVSEYVGRILSLIREADIPYQLTAMGTIFETEDLSQSLGLIEKANNLLSPDCDRIYCSAKFDIRKGKTNCMKNKIESVKNRIGEVNT